MENKTTFHVSAGVIIGILLSGVGLSLTQDLWKPAPVVDTKIVTKEKIKEVKVPVVQEKIVTREVPTPKVVSENESWKATVTDADGNVKQYLVKKVKYIIVGAILTEMDGTEIQVDGDDLKVERVE